MLDSQFIRQHPDRVRAAIENKGAGSPALVDRALELDEEHRAALTSLHQAQADANKAAASIGELIRSGDREAADAARMTAAENKSRVRDIDTRARELASELHRVLLDIPNVPHESVPVGKTPDENVVVFETGRKPAFDFEPKPHWELLESLELADFERGAKVSGAGFPFYTGKGARLQRALVNFFIDLAVSEGGYLEMQPPLLINEESATGTGQLPDKEDLMYETARDELYLVPTAEVPITNFYREEILPEAALPVKFCAYTPCFRREAGSYGKDVRGLNRLHQFDKVELVQFVRPTESYEALETLRADAERVLERLGLPYRRLLMCTGDMGFTQAKKYDLEVWSAAQERWLEVSSISNFESYQARRMKIRYKPEDGDKPVMLHTLNGSALALPRVLAALLENNQDAGGAVAVPDVLRPYAGFDTLS